jgi:hypothetical protein
MGSGIIATLAFFTIIAAIAFAVVDLRNTDRLVRQRRNSPDRSGPSMPLPAGRDLAE